METQAVQKFIAELLNEMLGDGDYRRGISDLLERLQKTIRSESSIELLPSLAFPNGDGKVQRAVPVIAAWQLIRIAAKLFDDVEDHEAGDRSSQVVNLATGCLTLAHAALEQLGKSGVPGERSDRIRAEFQRACLLACNGQHTDLSLHWDRDVLDPDAWLEVARAKSGVLFGWAAWAGAVLAEMSAEAEEAFRSYGAAIGILTQIADDFSGFWSLSGKSDLSADRLSLPICYARHVARDREWDMIRVSLEIAAAGDPKDVRMARDLIAGLGCRQYMLAAAWIYRKQAVDAIHTAGAPAAIHPQLIALADSIFPSIAQDCPGPNGTQNESLPCRE